MARQHEGDVEFIGVAAHDTRERMAEFVDRNGIAMIPHVIDENLSAWSRYGIPGHGAWVFIDGETGQETVRVGELGFDGLQAAIDELL